VTAYGGFVAIVVIDNHEVQTYTAPGKNERVASIMSALDARIQT